MTTGNQKQHVIPGGIAETSATYQRALETCGDGGSCRTPTQLTDWACAVDRGQRIIINQGVPPTAPAIPNTVSLLEQISNSFSA